MSYSMCFWTYKHLHSKKSRCSPYFIHKRFVFRVIVLGIKICILVKQFFIESLCVVERRLGFITCVFHINKLSLGIKNIPSCFQIRAGITIYRYFIVAMLFLVIRILILRVVICIVSRWISSNHKLFFRTNCPQIQDIIFGTESLKLYGKLFWCNLVMKAKSE